MTPIVDPSLQPAPGLKTHAQDLWHQTTMECPRCNCVVLDDDMMMQCAQCAACFCSSCFYSHGHVDAASALEESKETLPQCSRMLCQEPCLSPSTRYCQEHALRAQCQDPSCDQERCFGTHWCDSHMYNLFRCKVVQGGERCQGEQYRFTGLCPEHFTDRSVNTHTGCQKITLHGKQCPNAPIDDSIYCPIHVEAVENELPPPLERLDHSCRGRTQAGFPCPLPPLKNRRFCWEHIYCYLWT